uniref:Uncharacterized protein n=1 Tax=Bicosoecida sp. CB-2014 TaxID=1486930 RepID=A0A7S1G835_9STRA|mmetsp:Transcript_1990/g.6367  ORF Transcript_1990/g.6367 Transcript_1990/m.6367 type:complete len:150 (+) Transcript_1990:382-831(+)
MRSPLAELQAAVDKATKLDELTELLARSPELDGAVPLLDMRAPQAAVDDAVIIVAHLADLRGFAEGVRLVRDVTFASGLAEVAEVWNTAREDYALWATFEACRWCTSRIASAAQVHANPRLRLKEQGYSYYGTHRALPGLCGDCGKYFE